MEITIPVTEEEKIEVINSIKLLNGIRHIKYMSQAMIANGTSIKATKVRAILAELINEKRITQYAATTNKKLQRYYYIINEQPLEAEKS